MFHIAAQQEKEKGIENEVPQHYIGRTIHLRYRPEDMPEIYIYEGESGKRLEYLRNVKGIGLFTGLPGTGKTACLRAFVSGLNPSLYKVTYLPMTAIPANEFYRGLAALGVAAFAKDLMKICGVSRDVFEPAALEAAYGCCGGSIRRLNPLVP